jgi:hypothetical protein
MKDRKRKFCPPWTRFYKCPYCLFPDYMHYEREKEDTKCLVRIQWQVDPMLKNVRS